MIPSTAAVFMALFFFDKGTTAFRLANKSGHNQKPASSQGNISHDPFQSNSPTPRVSIEAPSPEDVLQDVQKYQDTTTVTQETVAPINAVGTSEMSLIHYHDGGDVYESSGERGLRYLEKGEHTDDIMDADDDFIHEMSKRDTSLFSVSTCLYLPPF